MKKLFALFMVVAMLSVAGAAFAANPTVTASPSYFPVKVGDPEVSSRVTVTPGNPGGSITSVTVNGEPISGSNGTYTVTFTPSSAGTFALVVTAIESYSDTASHGTTTATGTATITVSVMEKGSASTGGVTSVTQDTISHVQSKFGADVKALLTANMTESTYENLEDAQEAVKGLASGDETVTALAALPTIPALSDDGNYAVEVTPPASFVENLGEETSADSEPVVFAIVVAGTPVRTQLARADNGDLITTKAQLRNALVAGVGLVLNIKTEGGQLVNTASVEAAEVTLENPVLVMIEASDEPQPTPGALRLTANQTTPSVALGEEVVIVLTTTNRLGTATYTSDAVPAAGLTLVGEGDTALATFAPTAVGTYRVVFTVTDSGRDTDNTATAVVTLTVTGVPGVGSSSGGCSAGSAVLAMAVLGAFIATRKK